MTLIFVGAVGTSFCLGRNFGVRGQRDMYTFSFGGQPSALVEENVRFGPDRYYVRLGDGNIINKGTIRTDDGKEVSVDSQQINSTRYSIKDSLKGASPYRAIPSIPSK